jgi:hypothetical protein
MLRYLLGTKFNQLFHNSTSGGLVADERGIIGIRFIEEILKERLQDFEAFVQHKKRVAG